MRTYNIPSCSEKNRKIIPIMPPDLALRLTLISSNYPCLKQTFMVLKVYEPLKFYCGFIVRQFRGTAGVSSVLSILN